MKKWLVDSYTTAKYSSVPICISVSFLLIDSVKVVQAMSYYDPP